MSRLAAAVAAAALAFPAAPCADPPRAEGRIVTDESRIEILGRPVRVGERIELPEGWIRVEEKGTEDENVGSFGVVPAESLRASGAPTQQAPASAGDPAPAAPEQRHCRAERAAYLAQLWKEAGIEVSSPDALLEGLEAGAHGPETGYYWFAFQTDPFRPLAWSSELRDRADALVRCVRGG